MQEHDGLVAFNAYQAELVAAVFERLLPADDHLASPVDVGAVTYLDRALAGAYQDKMEVYRIGLAALDRAARERFGRGFAGCADAEQDWLLESMDRESLPHFRTPPQKEFFELLLTHAVEGVFSDPAHGGNRGAAGWRFLGHPGVWLENTAEENLSPEPVTKGGEVRTLADAGWRIGGEVGGPLDIPGYDPQESVAPPVEDADVVIVGMGAVGGFVAPMLTDAGLRVVAFEAGPWKQAHDYHPDEVNAAYYARGAMGPKFLAEAPRWRRNDGEPTRPATFSLGRMMNGVGGSIIHWGGALRRMHPHHFRALSMLLERHGPGVLPEHATLADWPLSYDDLAPHYDAVEQVAGVAGDDSNPFTPRTTPLPMPPLRTFTKAELFRDATTRMGLHPYPTPAGINSVPYNGLPATRYHSWSAGFGSFHNDRWNPGLSSVQQALASGRLSLRTHTRVVRILTDADGHAAGVEYVGPDDELRVQRARTVILASYTFENVRLMLMSATDRLPGGVGNGAGQVGRHFMIKQWADVYGYFPDTVFNAHTGPAAQMWSLDDYNAESFDAVAHGFVGGFTLNIENQALPLSIAKDPVPPGLRRWGREYKDHLRRWQHVCAVRIQPDALSYRTDYLDLDPRHRDRSGLGLPVIRMTTDMRGNEARLADFAEARCAEILREMGATTTWAGPRLRGVVSSHDLGGARMGQDPATSVVDHDLQVHDTPGLYVFGGAVFPTCTGVNPQLTIWALAHRATTRLVSRLERGEDRHRKPADAVVL